MNLAEKLKVVSTYALIAFTIAFLGLMAIYTRRKLQEIEELERREGTLVGRNPIFNSRSSSQEDIEQLQGNKGPKMENLTLLGPNPE